MPYPLIKRDMDITVGSLPLLAVVAAAIRLESAGSPLFFQARIGQGGKTFKIAKFRSMVKEAPRLGTYVTAENDPRITRIVTFIRRTSIDELPQLWNVLAGDMSLVGPRPETSAQEALFTPANRLLRHPVHPGITKQAQVSGRSSLIDNERLIYDLSYTPTIKTDFDIVLKTALHALRPRGVN